MKVGVALPPDPIDKDYNALFHSSPRPDLEDSDSFKPKPGNSNDKANPSCPSLSTSGKVKARIKNKKSRKGYLWFECGSCKNVAAILIRWQYEFECEKPIDLFEGIYLLLIIIYSKTQFAICNKHFLKLYVHLHIIVSKPTIMAIQVNQLWESHTSYSTLLEFVCNNRVVFPKNSFWNKH